MASKSLSWEWRAAAGVLGAGCVLAGSASPLSAQVAKSPTFTKDIAPIFQEKCESCHRPASMAPMSLITYEQVRPWAKAIASRVETRQMPPWHIDRTIGIQQFKNDRSLSDEQLAADRLDRKSTRLNSSHVSISYAVFCLKKKKASQPPLKS